MRVHAQPLGPSSPPCGPGSRFAFSCTQQAETTKAHATAGIGNAHLERIAGGARQVVHPAPVLDDDGVPDDLVRQLAAAKVVDRHPDVVCAVLAVPPGLLPAESCVMVGQLQRGQAFSGMRSLSAPVQALPRRGDPGSCSAAGQRRHPPCRGLSSREQPTGSCTPAANLFHLVHNVDEVSLHAKVQQRRHVEVVRLRRVLGGVGAVPEQVRQGELQAVEAVAVPVQLAAAQRAVGKRRVVKGSCSCSCAAGGEATCCSQITVHGGARRRCLRLVVEGADGAHVCW